MKNLINKSLLFVMAFVVCSSVFGQDVQGTTDKIAGCIKTGNAKELASYFHTNIELTVLDNDGTYSKSQAEIIMRDFFVKNPPNSFTVNHKGASKDQTQFFIGSYKTSNNQELRIYILLKTYSDKLFIQQLQIQE